EPLTLFTKDSVYAELTDMLETLGTEKDKREEKINKSAGRFGLSRLLDAHPYDLSGGEQQKCALAKILLSSPELLLLDEPTKGLDAFSKAELKKILLDLKNDGVTVIAVSHDIEFAAENADRCGLLFDGEIMSEDVPQRFFAVNNYYTTASSRMARIVFPNAVTCDQVVSMIKGDKI
ncbi:MAG: ATP-binding cassette domain-containing protein, partial [Clostridia bacterium]|nr:ATP-binding cassette domain-containing protein [Clostridia bacterium]